MKNVTIIFIKLLRICCYIKKSKRKNSINFKTKSLNNSKKV